MKQIDYMPNTGDFAKRLVLALIALGCVWTFAAASANAAFEGVGCFGSNELGAEPPESPQDACSLVSEEKFGEEAQLGGVGGLAVNYTGAGEVPAGTVYAVTSNPQPTRVAMYEPKADGGLEFVMGWQVTVVEEEYERCGPPGPLPDGETVHPSCSPRPKGQSNSVPVDIAVDQQTGNVYVQFLTGSGPVGAPAVVEYAPVGFPEITRFGPLAAEGETTQDAPEKVHNVAAPGGIAVNGSGEVFVSDQNVIGSSRYYRLMRFRPKVPNDFTEYEYVVGGDVAAGFSNEVSLPTQPAVDVAGHVYFVTNESTIEMRDPDNPKDPAICQFEFPAGNVQGMTVDPTSGSVFFYSSNTPKRVRQLGPCDEGTGEFAEVGQTEVKPERSELWALIFDPVRKFSPTRPAGVLYGAASAPKPNGPGGQPGQGGLGYIFAPIEEAPPVVSSESVSQVRATSASLHAIVDPEGFKTHYAFQYITKASFEAGGESFEGTFEAPLGGAEAGEGKVGIPVAISAVGLEPDTEYRYRVLASSKCSPGEPEKVCEVAGEAAAFRTYPTAVPGLPDHRAYELVSPVQKQGGQVFPIAPQITTCVAGCKPGIGVGRFPMQSSPDGGAIVYEGTNFGSGVGPANENEYVARRTSSGWQSTNPTPQALESRVGDAGYRAFSEDLREAVLLQAAPGGLSPESPSGYANLYAQSVESPFGLRPFETTQPPNRLPSGGEEFVVKYAGASGDLSQAFFAANDALTGASPVAPEAVDGGSGKFNLYEWERATGQLRLVNVMSGNTETAAGASIGAASANAVSVDGQRVFWSDESGQLYVREDANETIEIPDSGNFLSAANDGSKVLLTNGHVYDLETQETIDLTGGGGGFQGLAGQSDDLSHIYFVDTQVLSGEEENGEGDKAQAGKPNLYSWQEGTTRFAATLLSADNAPSLSVNTGILRDWVPIPTDRTAKASPSGRYLAFVSLARLTGYDNEGSPSARCKVTVSGPPIIYGLGPCAEVFLFDSASGELSCPSCNPGNAPPLGWSQLPVIEGPSTLPQPNVITDSGRLYFDSGDSLTLSDTNDGVQDVYQWEPNGVATCKREGGCLSLISAGSEGVDSNFAAADETGKNVFFTSRDQLVLRDKDELIDLYDAREFGGIAAETETQRPECQGEACLPAPSPPSNPTPASSSFHGAGNLKEKKQAKKHKKKRKHKHARKQRRAKHEHGGAR